MKHSLLILFSVAIIACVIPWPPIPEPVPTPTPTPTPTPAPEPTPIPELGIPFPQGIPESEFTGLPETSLRAKVVNEVMAEVTGCDIGSRCVHGKSPQEFMSVVVRAIRERGIGAGQHIDGVTDEIAVLVDEEACRWEGYHIAYHGTPSTVVWAPGAVRPSWRIPSRYCADPPDPGSCLPPVPDRRKLKMKVKEHGHHIYDLTPILFNACVYCREIGLGEIDGVVRCSCPMRPDGHPERSACEQFVLGGAPRWFCDGVEIESLNNPFQAYCAGEVKACNTELTVCSE